MQLYDKLYNVVWMGRHWCQEHYATEYAGKKGQISKTGRIEHYARTISTELELPVPSESCLPLLASSHYLLSLQEHLVRPAMSTKDRTLKQDHLLLELA